MVAFTRSAKTPFEKRFNGERLRVHSLHDAVIDLRDVELVLQIQINLNPESFLTLLYMIGTEKITVGLTIARHSKI